MHSMGVQCSRGMLISSMKIPLYLVSVVPLLFSWVNSEFSRLPVFVLSMIFVLFSQFLMNAEMDRLDKNYGNKGIRCSSILPIGPCIFECLDQKIIRKAETISLVLVILTSSLVIIITRLALLIIIGMLAIILMFAYLYPPIKLYKRGIGEISTFFDFGPLLLLGSYYAFTGSMTYSLIPASIGFGLIASAIRFSHHVIEEQEKSIRKRMYVPLFFLLIVVSAIITGWQLSLKHIILITLSFFVGSLPLMTKDNQKVSTIAIAFLVIFAILIL